MTVRNYEQYCHLHMWTYSNYQNEYLNYTTNTRFINLSVFRKQLSYFFNKKLHFTTSEHLGKTLFKVSNNLKACLFLLGIYSPFPKHRNCFTFETIPHPFCTYFHCSLLSGSPFRGPFFLMARDE